MSYETQPVSTLEDFDGGARAAGITRMGEGTRAVHAGLPAPSQGEPFLPGPVLAAPHHMSGEADAEQFAYQRYGNPTWTRYERALAELEGGGEATVFASRMAAGAGVLFSLLGPGTALVAPGDAYPGVRMLARERLAPFGVDVRLVATDYEQIDAAIAARGDARELAHPVRIDAGTVRDLARAPLAGDARGATGARRPLRRARPRLATGL